MFSKISLQHTGKLIEYVIYQFNVAVVEMRGNRVNQTFRKW